MLGIGQPGYPRRLADCGDAPLLLYVRGAADLDATHVLAVVGTRKATWTGRDQCRRIVENLAELEEKPLIVSGLALGIDGCAHEAALAAGLPTVGVLPCGPEAVYPRQHQALADRMLERGALVTDFARGIAPEAYTFLRRNRIIAGLADAVLLVESYQKGGGLITASLAASYNREVYAVPGRPTDASFEGCNRLIAAQEAVLVGTRRGGAGPRAGLARPSPRQPPALAPAPRRSAAPPRTAADSRRTFAGHDGGTGGLDQPPGPRHFGRAARFGIGGPRGGRRNQILCIFVRHDRRYPLSSLRRGLPSRF